MGMVRDVICELSPEDQVSPAEKSGAGARGDPCNDTKKVYINKYEKTHYRPVPRTGPFGKQHDS